MSKMNWNEMKLQEVMDTLREITSVSTETNPEIVRGIDRLVAFLGREQQHRDAASTTIREIAALIMPNRHGYCDAELVASVKELVERLHKLEALNALGSRKEPTVAWRGSVSELLADLRKPLSTYDLRKLAAEILPLTGEEARPLGERDAQNANLRSKEERNIELEEQLESLRQRNRALARAVLQIVQLSNTAAITEIMSALET